MESEESSMTPTEPYRPPAHDGGGHPAAGTLGARYQKITEAGELFWATRYRKLQLLGRGGQGAVFLAHRLGADGFDRPVALKFFSPESYGDDSFYQEDMARVAQIAARVARIQHD